LFRGSVSGACEDKGFPRPTLASLVT
jgi:hypothetical protein